LGRKRRLIQALGETLERIEVFDLANVVLHRELFFDGCDESDSGDGIPSRRAARGRPHDFPFGKIWKYRLKTTNQARLVVSH
jgi:hypothetical protein